MARIGYSLEGGDRPVALLEVGDALADLDDGAGAVGKGYNIVSDGTGICAICNLEVSVVECLESW